MCRDQEERCKLFAWIYKKLDDYRKFEDKNAMCGSLRFLK